jgi:thioester reductase-like protein
MSPTFNGNDIAKLSSEEKRALLIKLLQKRLSASTLDDASVRNGLEVFEQISRPVAELSREAVLDPTIQPEQASAGPVTELAQIFLTGATGFLGAFLLHDLLRQTQAKIYCLVRCADGEEGKQRLLRNLQTYLPSSDYDRSRIIPVPGNLAEPLLGLAPQEFQELAGTIDTIFHNGALVNWIYPYERLKPANVLGTQETLRLASQTMIKPVHYVSSLAVFPLLNNGELKVVQEPDPLDHGGMLYGGYTQSKWVAEQLVVMARARGLPVCIYRPGLITGHSRTGISNTEDFTCKLIKSWIKIGSAPDLDATMDMTPVDYVSSAIVHLSRMPHSLGEVFHLANPHPIPMKELIACIRACGYPLESIPYVRWRAELLDLAGRSDEQAMNSLVPLFTVGASAEVSGWASSLPRFGLQKTLDALSGAPVVCPPADARLLKTYFSFFIGSGFLEAPVSGRVTALEMSSM